MRGQWVSDYQGLGQRTRVVVDIDERKTHYQGVVTLFSGVDLPLFEFYFATEDKGPTQYVRNLRPFAFRWGIPEPLTHEELTAWLPSWTFARSATFGLELVGDTLCGAWAADIFPHGGTITFERSKAGAPSEMQPNPAVKDWESFKAYVDSLPDNRHFFRGQGHAHWKLRTSFHRALRYDIHRLIAQDLPAAYRELLPALGGDRFNLSDGKERASFLHLLQHYGYPTPLLDWSKSPFVAAYFAFQDRRKPGEEGSVRVHVFAPRVWESRHSRVPALTQVGPVISVMEVLPLANYRSKPQQSVHTATNIDDLEDFLLKEEKLTGERYLEAIDLPYSERMKALRDLKRMGITADSLLGGLDGACRTIGLDHFDFDMNP